MNKVFQFPYGHSFLKASLPSENVSTILKSRRVKGIKDPVKTIQDSLRCPTDKPPLRDCVKANDKVVVIVTDNTRPCPDAVLLPPILAELETIVPHENITIIVALGMHPALCIEDLKIKLGKDIINKYRVLNHDPCDTVNIGVTSRGIPVEINRRVVKADFRISTGFIEPHFFAGFSGGCKSIFPGVSGTRSIHINHGFDMVDHQCARAGILEGNPVYEDIVEQARMARLDFIVNVLLNEKREITHVFAGDPVTAHCEGCEIEKSIAGVTVDHKFDITITTNSGMPLDLDFYQTCKGIENASRITRGGGIIIIASACCAGVGPAAYYNLHASSKGPQEVLQKIRECEPFGVQWQNQILARVQLNNDIYLVSGLGGDLARNMMVTPVSTVESGLQKAFEKIGKDAEIALILEGPLVLPIVAEK